jgi:Amt family ammonium transporter
MMRRPLHRFSPLALALVAILPAAPAAAEVSSLLLDATIEALRLDQQLRADFTWMLTCAGLVLLMQIGFLMLEAGSARSKNSINVAQKNLCDLLISICAFAMVGFSFMFGSSQFGVIGWDKQHLASGFQDEWTYAFFAFHAMFVSTAATIVSGAVAERMKFKTYALITLLLAALIYPVLWPLGVGRFAEPGQHRLAGRSWIY